MEAAAAGKDVGLVVFNAGGDDIGGNFLNSDYADWRKLTLRNIDTLTEASHRFAKALVGRGRGGLLLVGSEAGFGGTGRLALYTATKAYQLAFGESLWQELKPRGVDVLNLLIGATDTPKLRGVLAKNGLSADDLGLTLPVDVARLGFENLGDGPTLCLTKEGADDQPLGSRRIRRERVVRQSNYLDNFYGPQT
jgi:short-subunit dehydrogenase